MSKQNLQSVDLPGYNGTIPIAAVHALEREATGILHGTIILSLYIKDGSLYRFTTSREQSFIPGKPTTGSTPNTVTGQ
jgi:hypothetical protein